jgi:hypothetical protein
VSSRITYQITHFVTASIKIETIYTLILKKFIYNIFLNVIHVLNFIKQNILFKKNIIAVLENSLDLRLMLLLNNMYTIIIIHPVLIRLIYDAWGINIPVLIQFTEIYWIYALHSLVIITFAIRGFIIFVQLNINRR